MARYILRPRHHRALSGVSLSTTHFSAKARKKQLRLVKKFRDSLEVSKALVKWLSEKKRGITRISDHFNMAATGTSVVEMTQEDAKSLESDMPDVQVIEDRPLDLIAPIRSTTTATAATPTDLWHLDAIGLTAARAAGFSGTGEGITVAVLDTGVDASHTEFDGKTIQAVTFDVDSWTAHPQTPSQDTEGHGTHVAGLVIGHTVGVAPGASVVNEIMIPGAQGMLSNFVLALEWSAAQPEIAIVNMSAGIRGFVTGMEDAIDDLMAVGVIPIIATGNEGRNRARSPGNYNPVLSVGASNVHGAVASFSSSGTFTVDNLVYNIPDLVAPGEGVTSCVMSGGYESWNGTSMATPIVSGIAALILEQHPSISVLELMDLLIDTCQDLGVSTERQGAGLVQIVAALSNNVATVSGSGMRSSRPRSAALTSPTTKKRKAKKKARKKAGKKATSAVTRKKKRAVKKKSNRKTRRKTGKKKKVTKKTAKRRSKKKSRR